MVDKFSRPVTKNSSASAGALDSMIEQAITRRDFVEGANSLLLAMSTSALVGLSAPAPAADALARMGSRKVREIENVWIPMSDGTRIAARMWLPDDADQEPVPAIMEYIPYRKRDIYRTSDEKMLPYLASYGYACIRPDKRGYGDSDGVPQDEYVKQEQDDGLEIIAWLTKQRWCTGKVGMVGISWGGFSALQIAARRPPALKAVMTHCSSDDRYRDDAHYTGGCINGGMFTWGSEWTTNGLLPPDPAIVGDRWREQWLQRLNNLDFFLGDWLTHQHRDAFWKHGSIAEDYGSITCGVYAVGGWADHYSRTVPRMLANLKCPRKGLIGPWAHWYPYGRTIGPYIDWLTEALRWWDYWLKGMDTGIMSEPMYRVWMQAAPAMRGMHSVPGRWVTEVTWPSARIKPTTYYLTSLGLERQAGPEAIRTLKPLQTVGMTAPRRTPFDMDTDLPADQRMDDVRSLTFDSAPLADDLEILGAPVVRLDLMVDKPTAFLIVRLNEVEPDGASKRLTFGVLNLTHRNGHEFPEALGPGKRYRVSVQLHDCGQVVKAGNRIRVATSTAYWPMIWPSPEPVRLTLYAGRSELDLPERPPRPQDAQLKPFGAPTVASPSDRTTGSSPPANPKVLEWDIGAQKLTFRASSDSSWRINATETEISHSYREVSEIVENDPTSARIEIRKAYGLKRGNWDTRSESIVRMSLTKDDLLLTGDVKAYEGGKEIFTKIWNHKIRRQLV